MLCDSTETFFFFLFEKQNENDLFSLHEHNKRRKGDEEKRIKISNVAIFGILIQQQLCSEKLKDLTDLNLDFFFFRFSANANSAKML